MIKHNTDLYLEAVEQWGRSLQLDVAIEEMTDVLVMLKQMQIMFNITDEQLQEFVTKKNSRLEKFLQETKL